MRLQILSSDCDNIQYITKLLKISLGKKSERSLEQSSLPTLTLTYTYTSTTYCNI